MKSRAVLCTFLALLAACPDDDPPAEPAPLTPTAKLDVVLLVDDSGSMGGEQELLAASLPSLYRALVASAPDVSLRLAVVTSTIGISFVIPGAPQCASGSGQFRPGSNCLKEGTFLVDEPGAAGRTSNAVDGAENALACMVDVGVAGCGFEQQFKAIRQSLDGTAGNADFLRDDAALLVLVLSDEDDCSGTPGDELYNPVQASITSLMGPLESFRCTEFGLSCSPAIGRGAASYAGCEPAFDSTYVESPEVLRDFLIAKKGGDARRVAVATIVGPDSPVSVAMTQNVEGAPVARLNPSCDAAPGNTPEIQDTAAPAVRIGWLAGQFTHSANVSICSAFGDSMGSIAQQALRAMGR